MVGRFFSFVFSLINICIHFSCRSQWPRGLRRRSAAARLLRLWVRIPPGAWKFVCCECCVLSGRGLCDELITSPEESYRLWCVVVCDLETSRIRRPWPALGRSATAKKKKKVISHKYVLCGWKIKLYIMARLCWSWRTDRTDNKLSLLHLLAHTLYRHVTLLQLLIKR